MKGLKKLRLGLVGIAAGALLLAGGLFLASQASAISGTLAIGSATAAPGGQASVDLTANVGSPGLGAWTVDILYDSNKVSVVSCAPNQTAGANVCNMNFVPGSKVRITGANPNGVSGNISLGTITFMCAAYPSGTSPLGVSASGADEVFADATIGAPHDIDETVTEGSINCAAPAPTVAAVATATPKPGSGGLPPTGTGGSSNGSDFSWLIASLAAAGVVALAGYGALRVRTRNS